MFVFSASHCCMKIDHTRMCSTLVPPKTASVGYTLLSRSNIACNVGHVNMLAKLTLLGQGNSFVCLSDLCIPNFTLFLGISRICVNPHFLKGKGSLCQAKQAQEIELELGDFISLTFPSCFMAHFAIAWLFQCTFELWSSLCTLVL